MELTSDVQRLSLVVSVATPLSLAASAALLESLRDHAGAVARRRKPAVAQRCAAMAARLEGVYLALGQAVRDLEAGHSLSELRLLTKARQAQMDEVGHNAQTAATAWRAGGAYDGYTDVLRRIADLARVLRLDL